ncbi:MAG: methyltransferase domain-containing protein [Bacteriovoracaceae bacterium]|nr:methyltransferase domain-containing protein [Bacteriovoracaceae bacterium]
MQTYAIVNKTKEHYNKYPFIEGGSSRILWWQNYLEELLPTNEIRDKLILDIGCGAGEIAAGLINRYARCVCLDLSEESLKLCKKNNPNTDIILGNALKLPFPDGSFDHTISIGVLHHTPDCHKGLKEAARVTASGGTFIVFLYNYWNIYHLIYKIFAPIRSLIPLDRVPYFVVAPLQIFVKMHLGQSLDRVQLLHLLGDKLWSPRASFHSIKEIKSWAHQEGFKILEIKRFFLGYANIYKLEKEIKDNVPTHSLAPRRSLQIQCLQCQALMRKEKLNFTCNTCKSKYHYTGGVHETTTH